MKELLRQIPSVDVILSQKELKPWYDVFSRSFVKDKTRETIEEIKNNIVSGNLTQVSLEAVISGVLVTLEGARHKSLRPVINGTGVLLHTNMGRALYSEKMADSVKEIITHYNTLEFDLENGKRGHRDSHIEGLIQKVTGAEASVVVNNNAAAVMLMLDSLSKGKEAIVSRGELVEIGGSFRVPSVMEASGAILKEIGTTNKTHVFDYENAITEETGVLLKVHTSNYKIMGFTSTVDAEDMVAVGRRMDIPVIEDLGAGSLVPLDQYDLEREPTVQEQVKKGVDLISFSGDKLLGGPQCGIIVGKKKYIDILKKNQLLRALRVGKMTLAVLQEVLTSYLYEKTEDLPFYEMLMKDESWFEGYYNRILDKFENRNVSIAMIDTQCHIGGGSLPMERMPSKGIVIQSDKLSANAILQQLRQYETPIIARIENDVCIVEMRTLSEKDLQKVVEGINHVE